MNNIQKISRLNLKELLPNKTIVIFGPRETGKTTLVQNILYAYSPYVRIPILFSATAGMNGDFDNCIPKIFIFNIFNENAALSLLTNQSIFKSKYKNTQNWDYYKKMAFYIFDDVVADNKSWNNNDVFNKIFYTGRHYESTIIITIHDPILLPSKLRAQVQYVFFTAGIREKDLKHFFATYWPEQYGNYSVFKDVFNKCTKGYKSLFINVEKINNNNMLITDIIKYVEPAPTNKLPKFKLGVKSIWNISKNFYNNKWKLKSIVNMKKKKENYKLSI